MDELQGYLEKDRSRQQSFFLGIYLNSLIFYEPVNFLGYGNKCSSVFFETFNYSNVSIKLFDLFS
ncbi:unnamed protein product [Musa acuminata subsp. malaccensis]|uniref:(wild Malaysian banana) hypothetical protein n=1 Tax=Musa acuminata subsp. malaccensis TaxID=214687 RepID=A0A8D7EV92_MUSAM|nr:unnamed protein product [Musa acuminata subsp. malaccensis]